MPGTGHCACFAAHSEIWAPPNSSEAPHCAQWPVPSTLHGACTGFLSF